MAINLQKGQKVSLTKENPGLARVVVGLGWDEVKEARGLLSFFTSKGNDIDCDASVFMLKNGKLCEEKDIVFFGNLKHKTGTVEHLGDNLTGAGSGDDERILVDLSKVPAEYDRIVFSVNIYDAVKRKQHFGMIKNAFIRLIDARNNTEVCRYNLTEDYAGKTAMIFGEIYRHDGEWKFNAIGQGTNDVGIKHLSRRFV